MFREYEVPAKFLPTNAIRYQAPMDVPALVPFYITQGNMPACTEVREYKYHEDLHCKTSSLVPKNKNLKGYNRSHRMNCFSIC